MSYRMINKSTGIAFDREMQVVRVYIYSAVIPGFRPQWQPVGEYTEEQWYESQYAQQIRDTDMIAMISYFWSDLEGEGL